MNLTVTDLRGRSYDVTAREGASLMEAMRLAGLPIAAQCGGCCSCATCHVHVDEAWIERLPPRSGEEEGLLELVEDLRPTSRLSCQITATAALDGLRLNLAPGSDG